MVKISTEFDDIKQKYSACTSENVPLDKSQATLDFSPRENANLEPRIKESITDKKGITLKNSTDKK